MEEVKAAADNSEHTTQNGMIPNHWLHEGKQLKAQLKKRHLTAVELAPQLGVTKQTMYIQMRRQYLSPRFKKKLSAMGLYPFTADHNVSLQEKGLNHTVTEQMLFQEVKRLQTIAALQAEHILKMGKLLSESQL